MDADGARRQAREQMLALMSRGAEKFPYPENPPEVVEGGTPPCDEHSAPSPSQGDIAPLKSEQSIMTLSEQPPHKGCAHEEMSAPVGAESASAKTIPAVEQDEAKPQEVRSPQERLSDIFACRRCPMSASRTRVVCEPRPTKRPVLFLSDFPGVEDEVPDLLFTPQQSPSNILHRLSDKLEISKWVHRAFALKCVPRRGIPNEALLQCVEHLRTEIEWVDPDVVVCFGGRAWSAVCTLVEQPMGVPPEMGQVGSVSLCGRQRRLFVFPAARELEAFREWRSAVWGPLQSLKSNV